MKKIILSLLLIVALERFCHWQTLGFSLSKMVLSSHPVPPSSTHLTLIGTGNQFYVFDTADHSYVVKFMKFSRRKPLPWLAKLPLPSFLGNWRNLYLAQRAKRLSHLQQSAALAQTLLADETALLTLSLPSTATLIDNLGIRHSIDLNQTHFFLQKKAAPFTTYFDNHPSEASTLITSYIQTVLSQCRKGVCNLDPLIERNVGVAHHRVVLLDIGSFLAHDKLKSRVGLQREIILELLPLRHWLQENHPEHLPYLDTQIQKTIALLNSPL